MVKKQTIEKIKNNKKRLAEAKEKLNVADNDFSKYLAKQKIALIEEEILFSERLLKTFTQE